MKTSRKLIESLTMVHALHPEECTMEEQEILAVGRTALQIDVLQEEKRQILREMSKKVLGIMLIMLPVMVFMMRGMSRGRADIAGLMFTVFEIIILWVSTRSGSMRLEEINVEHKALSTRLLSS